MSEAWRRCLSISSPSTLALNQQGSDDDSDDGEDVLDPESGSKNPQFQLTFQMYPLNLLL